MSEHETGGGNKGVGRGRGAPGRSSVRQSFSHGRSKAVVVEKKRKRVVTPGTGAASGGAAAAAAAAVKGAARTERTERGGTAARGTGGARPERQERQETPERPQRARADGTGAARGNRGPRPRMLNTRSADEAQRRLEAIRQHQKDEEVRKRREAEEERRRIEESERRAEEAARREAEEKAAEEQRRREAEQEEARRKAEEAEAAVEAAKAEAAPARAAPAERAAPREAEAEEGRGRGRGAPRRAAPARTREEPKRRTGRLTITQALTDGEGGRQRSLAAMRRRQERERRRHTGPVEREKVVREVQIPEAITVQELANRMAERVADVIKTLMSNGIMATQNQSIDQDTAELIVEEFGHKVRRVSAADVESVLETAPDSDEDLVQRAPVVTIMGHVDHGKTSLLDALRKTSVVTGEAGGITQHIGAYQITAESGQKLTFLDTPGHAAFTSMRARGAQVTDIVVRVLAADDSVMPQTGEAIDHAKAAEVPLSVAINKIDKPAADAQRVRTELLRHEIVVEEMGGDVLDVEVSALTGKGLDKLIEAIALQSELLELKANPDRPAEGAVIEAQLDVGRGPVATVLVQRGTLRTGDIFVVGEQWGRVRALVDDKGERVDEAGPSVPVEVLGLQGTPEAGDALNVVESEGRAREIADYRARVTREKLAVTGARATLDQLLAQARVAGQVSELPVVVKADVQGSTEAIVQALEKVGNEEVRVAVLHRSEE